MNIDKKTKMNVVVKNVIFILIGVAIMIIGFKVVNYNSIEDQREELWKQMIEKEYDKMNSSNRSAIKDFNNDIRTYFWQIRKRIPAYADNMTDLSSQFGYAFNKVTDIFRKKRNETALKNIMAKFYRYFPDNEKFKKDILYKYSLALYKIRKNYNNISEKILIAINKDKELFEKTQNQKFEFDKNVFFKDSKRLALKFSRSSLESFLISEVGFAIIIRSTTKLASLTVPKSGNPWVLAAQAVVLIGGGWYINKRAEKKIIKNMNIIINEWEKQFLSSTVFKSMQNRLLKMEQQARIKTKTTFFE